MTVNYDTATFNTEEGQFAKAISIYADAARADEALIISSGITGSDARVTDSGEGSTGIIRWLDYTDATSLANTEDASKPLTGSVGDPLNTFLGITNYQETYTKNVDVVAARENSIQSLLSRVDGLSFLGRNFGSVRARKEDQNLRAVLKGIGARMWQTPAASTVATEGTKVGPTISGVAHEFGYLTAVTTGAVDNSSAAVYEPLFENETTANNRSAFFDVLLDAMTAVSGEFEEAFYYLMVSPETFNTLRKQNVLDINPVQDGNLNINTLLGGKIRLIVSGNAQKDMVSDAGITPDVDNDQATLNVSYLLKAGAFHYSNVPVNNPTAVDTNPLTNRGFGDVSIVSRWGNIIHPRGYSWGNTTNGTFPGNTMFETASSWTPVARNVNQTGIFPIFHG